MKVCVSGAQGTAAFKLNENPHQSINVRIAPVMLHWWFMAHWELVSSFRNFEMNGETLHVLQTFKMDLLLSAHSISMLCLHECIIMVLIHCVCVYS